MHNQITATQPLAAFAVSCPTINRARQGVDQPNQHSAILKHKPLVFASIFLLSINFPLHAQILLENIYVRFSGQYYLIPDLAKAISPELASQYGVSGSIVPYLGFRAGAGYGWRNWSFGAESGYTYIKGDNPLVTDIAITPLLLKAGYSFFPITSYRFFSLTPTAALGIVFAKANHYKDVIDMLTDNITVSSNTGFMAQIGLQAAWNPVRQWGRAFEIFARFSIDGIIEKGGLIPLPQIEIGITIRPFAFKTRPVPVTHIEEKPIVETPVEIIAEEEEAQEAEPPQSVRYLWLVLFPPDEMSAVSHGNAVLDEAGAVLAEMPTGAEFRIILRGYSAPYVSVSGQREVSRRRALYCADYLRQRYGIPDERITVEWYGAEALPENIEENDHVSRRSVEIIFEGEGYEKRRNKN